MLNNKRLIFICMVFFILLIGGCSLSAENEIQSLLDKQCKAYITKDFDLMLSTFDPTVVSQQSSRDLAFAEREFYKANIKDCEMKVLNIDFNEDDSKATVTVFAKLKGWAYFYNLPVEQEINETKTFFFIKVESGWKSNQYDFSLFLLQNKTQ